MLALANIESHLLQPPYCHCHTHLTCKLVIRPGVRKKALCHTLFVQQFDRVQRGAASTLSPLPFTGRRQHTQKKHSESLATLNPFHGPAWQCGYADMTVSPQHVEKSEAICVCNLTRVIHDANISLRRCDTEQHRGANWRAGGVHSRQNRVEADLERNQFCDARTICDHNKLMDSLSTF